MANNESRLVYSTDSGRIKQAPTEQIAESDGTVRIRRETKGRKGKGCHHGLWLGPGSWRLKNTGQAA